MTAEIHELEPMPGSGRTATPRLRTLVVCDIADSTVLVERMEDPKAANIIRKHDRLARALVERQGGREIDRTDGFLLLFERPIQAAAFALGYQRGRKQGRRWSSTRHAAYGVQVAITPGRGGLDSGLRMRDDSDGNWMPR